ncbi:CD276 antigen-like [Erpetoichthys calabaricus]|uniref:CD276 antigen-like n=1 Tax=Erpetoichthys calabaricus TaxID=27687 RepID=A0A8C4SK74_ERPCA|nr:CD276 antigen-like [Erpetoichthys calabaricus]
MLAFYFLLCFCEHSSLAGTFQVQVPKETLAIQDQPLVLECSFSHSSHVILDKLIVTWQRNDKDVAHSFYYGTDQLTYQSPRYLNRTSLYHEQLQQGNASLRLEPVFLEDAGLYICSVNTEEGTGKSTTFVTFAAYYLEPELIVAPQIHHTSFCFRTMGYPEPRVQWLSTDGRHLSHNTEILQSPANGGLFMVNSVLEAKAFVKLTFILENMALNQTITRHISLTQDVSNKIKCEHKRWMLLLFIPFCLLLVFLVWRKKKPVE